MNNTGKVFESNWQSVKKVNGGTLVTILPLKSKLSRKFQRFNAKIEVSKCQKIVQFSKVSIKMKIVKYFARPKQRATLRKLFSHPPSHTLPDKTMLRLWNKRFLKEIYRNIQTFPFKCFKNVILGRQ